MVDTIKNKDLFDYVTDVLNQRRTYYEPAWYSNLHAYENNHFVGWNPGTKSIQLYPTKKKFFIQFPEVKRQVDGFENLMLSSNPVYQVYPTDYSDQKQQEDAKFQSLFLKQHYLDWHEDNILHSVIHNGGVLPFSFIEIAVEKEWDIESGKYISTTVPRSLDAFDVGFDGRYSLEKNPCLVKIIRTTQDAVEKSHLYKDFKGKNITSFPQDYKEIYFIDKFGSGSYRNTNRLLLAECHVKDGEDIKIVTIDGGGQVLRETKIKGMPFYSIVMFQPSGGNPFQPSYLENLLPMNRSMDLIGNRIESMAMKYVKGSYLMPANTSVSMSDEDGTLMTYKGLVPPIVLPNPQLPEWAWQFMTFLQTSSDRYGINPITLGGAPKGSNMRSGKMMDKTNQNALNQQRMFLSSFTYMLKRSAEIMTFLESRLLTEPRKHTIQTPDQSFTTKQFVGSDYYDLYKDDPNIIPLPKTFKKLTVEIEDESTHGIQAKRETFERMAKLYNDVKQNDPELMPEMLALFLKTGDIATVMGEAQKSGTLLASPAFQNILKNLREGVLDHNPPVKQAVAMLAQALAQDPSIEKENGGIPEGVAGKGGGDQGGGQPPAPAAAPQQPPQGGK